MRARILAELALAATRPVFFVSAKLALVQRARVRCYGGSSTSDRRFCDNDAVARVFAGIILKAGQVERGRSLTGDIRPSAAVSRRLPYVAVCCVAIICDRSCDRRLAVVVLLCALILRFNIITHREQDAE